ncbi:transglycosylase family protein [Streptomyces sp. NPDC051555]|uniref:transglycosylase family protein n=1 Tax=Streptomyces sp. NPDC051555 TaxID=3365657 RepID=UPI00379D076F
MLSTLPESPLRPRISRWVRRSVAVATGSAAALVSFFAGGAHAASIEVWDRVADCESTGDWQINSGNGFYGGLQFTAATWAEFGGTRFGPRADLTSRDDQIAVAEKVLAAQGPGAWPVCSAKAGLTRGAAAVAGSETAAQAPAAGADAAAVGAPEQGPQAVDTPTATYKIKKGDSLRSIAERLHTPGGWQHLYDCNQRVIGSNPLVLPEGARLSVGSTAIDTAPSFLTEETGTPAGDDDTGAAPAATGGEQAPAAVAKAVGPASEIGTAVSAVAPVQASVTTPYRQAGAMWSSGYHTGVDFVAAVGTPVKAVAAGEVVSAGNAGAYGNEVVIRHADGKYSQYAHLSRLEVSRGQHVLTGAEIGLSGATGNVSGPHLHFEVRTGPGYGSDIDPVAYLRGLGVTV